MYCEGLVLVLHPEFKDGIKDRRTLCIFWFDLEVGSVYKGSVNQMFQIP